MLASLLLACSPKAAPETAEAAAPTPVQAVRLDAGSGGGDLTATGTLERRREMTLSFRIPGVMTMLAVDEGDPVRKGQVLATIDPSSVEAADLAARSALERAQLELNRNRTLFARGFVSQARIDDLEAAVKAAQAQADATAFDRRWAQLVSPVNGAVLSREGQAGEVVQPGKAVLRVSDESSPLIVRAAVADRDIDRVRIGAGARLRLSGSDTPYSGRVAKIGESAGVQTGAVEVEIEINGGRDLRSGQIAEVTIDAPAGSRAESAFSRAPAEAILEANDAGASVLVVEGGKARRKQVAFGGFDGDFALISGLPAGAQVITAGAGYVTDGDAVLVVDPSNLPQPAGEAP